MTPENRKTLAMGEIRRILKETAKEIPQDDENSEDWYENLLGDVAEFCLTDATDFDRPEPEEDDEDEGDSWVEDDDDSDLK